MPPSMPSSSGSASCRIEWRPSRWEAGALVAISCAAGVAVLSIGLPRTIASPLAMLALAAGLRDAWRRWHRPARLLELADRRARLDGREITWRGLQWRGSLAVATLRGADDRVERLAWWPDTLPAERRRELRLAAVACRAAPPGASAAP